MPRETLADGSIWTDDRANASLRPFISELDENGSTGELVKDTHLDGGTDQIKARFYGWYDRVKITAVSGLTVSYSGGKVASGSAGTVTTVAPGNLILPASQTNFIFINSSAAVAYAPSIPNEGILLAKVTTNGTDVTAIEDLRYQTNEQIRPLSLPSDASPFYAGMIMPTMASSAPPGWLLCQGQAISRTDYSVLFAAIGVTHGAGNGSTTFNLPDLRGRVLVGAGTGAGLSAYALGNTGGAETVQLTVGQIPSHTHAINDPSHTHAINDSGHDHGVIDSGHVHGVNDPGHVHPSLYKRAVVPITIADNGAELSQANITPNLYGPIMQSAQTGISINSAPSYVSIRNSRTNVSAQATTTGITAQAQGGNGAHENRQPYAVCNYIIRAI